MGKNRDRLDIMADIVKAAVPRSNKTNIMFSANLSFKLLEKYLGLVMNAGLVQAHDSEYLTTELGLEFLARYANLQSRYVRAQKKLETLNFEYERLSSFARRRE